MKFRRLSLIAMLLAATAATSAMPSSSSWDEEDDDIYYNASKDKSSATQKQTKQAAGNSGYYYTPNTIVNYPDPAGYVPQGSGLDMDVDAYNRRGQFLVADSVPADSLDALLDSYAYTRRIEKFSNPDIVNGSGNQALIDSYYSQPATDINVYVVNASPWATWPYSSWYSPWYNWYGPSWSWSWNMGWYDPWYSWSWGWGPGYWPGTPPVGDLHGVRHGVPDGILHPAPDIGPETRPAAHARTIQQVAPPPSDAAPEPSVPEPALPDPATWETTATTVPFRPPIPTLDRHRPAPRAPTDLTSTVAAIIPHQLQLHRATHRGVTPPRAETPAHTAAPAAAQPAAPAAECAPAVAAVEHAAEGNNKKSKRSTI